MHLWLTLYFCTWCIVISNDIYATFTLSLLVVLLQWTYGLAKMEKHNVEPFQFCVSCRKMTPQHYIHCKVCKLCTPVDYVHTVVGCMSEFAQKRYMALLYIIFAYITIILCLWSFFIHYYVIGLVIHIVAIYTFFKQKNINTNFVY